jgi:glycosyltransferase involved in cell wall biosynthesis
MEPLIDGRKEQLLRNAAALLFALWAMACGTPVIGFPCGSVPEVIDHGVTDFIVADEAEAIRAVGHVDALDRQGMRAIFEQTCRENGRSPSLALPLSHQTAAC